MNETEFHVRPYSKRELAIMYFPDTVNEESAVANFRRMMARNQELFAELKKACYSPSCKRFTPRQVRILFRYLGEP